MGINPGETAIDHTICAAPTEETSMFDFHEHYGFPRGASSKKWIEYAEFYCGTKNIVLSEVFFWSARNQKETIERFGDIWNSKHLSFCVEMNKILLQEHQPKAVIFSGIGKSELVQNIFNLRIDDTYFSPTTGRKLIHLCSENSTKWFITTHWTSTWGLTNNERDEMKAYIQDSIEDEV
jgi:hypothetical protein